MQAGSATSRTIGISWVERNPKQIVDCVKMRISDGGCAAIICNTVHKAQDLFQAFNAEYQGEAIDIILFHGRFPYQWRKEIEDKILRLFSKEQQYRPKKAILIATQVIEQSLDLDFDLMISDLAPIDLLIQRIGRLHRHTPMVERPLKLNKPEFIISSFSSLDQIVATYEDSFIYSPYILGKTYVALNGKNKLVLPDETDELIESVYSELADEKPVLQKARADMLKGIENSKRNAQNYLIPHSNKDFIGSLKNFFGDDPGSLSQRYIQAPTREMDASLQIVCFEKRGEEIFTFDRDNPIDLNKKLSEEEVMDCLKAEITLSSPGIIRDILNQPHNSSPGFHSTAALRWHIPIFFTYNIDETEHYLLTLNKDIGLKIEKKK
jgi:CRISPR-associated endonuclease/helicase Cas3